VRRTSEVRRTFPNSRGFAVAPAASDF